MHVVRGCGLVLHQSINKNNNQIQHTINLIRRIPQRRKKSSSTLRNFPKPTNQSRRVVNQRHAESLNYLRQSRLLVRLISSAWLPLSFSKFWPKLRKPWNFDLQHRVISGMKKFNAALLVFKIQISCAFRCGLSLRMTFHKLESKVKKLTRRWDI